MLKLLTGDHEYAYYILIAPSGISVIAKQINMTIIIKASANDN